ncbi:MAG TPA: hypothetical protein VFQ35_08195 [Polyangiaceae bacterium]|nr:hypothetical protein [Polyangiaceae bacterium]
MSLAPIVGFAVHRGGGSCGGSRAQHGPAWLQAKDLLQAENSREGGRRAVGSEHAWQLATTRDSAAD